MSRLARDHGMRIGSHGRVKFCRCPNCVHDSIAMSRRRPTPRDIKERASWVASVLEADAAQYVEELDE
jgi:hypothetical protein